jgi:hypothetical protein
MGDVSYGAKLGGFWAPNRWATLWLAFGLAPLFFFETLVHEGLHFITGVLAGFDPSLIPFAHFNIAFMRNVNGATMNIGGFVATPQIVCLIALVLLIAVFIFTSPRWRWLRTFLVWWYLGLVLDLLFNTGLGLFGASRDGTDWYKFGRDYGGTLSVVLSWLILLAVLSQLVWIQFSRWHLNQPQALGFFDFRGTAMAFAAVSLIAIVVSLAVDHPSVVRNWWFWAVWTFQLISFVWYVSYAVWASVR